MKNKFLREIFRFRNRPKLIGKYKHIWIEESFDLENTANTKLGITHTNAYLGTSINRSHRRAFLIIIGIIYLILLGRIVYLQIWQGRDFLSIAEANRLRLKTIPAERGILYDRLGRQLVENVPTFSLLFIPQDLPRDFKERSEILEKVSLLSGVPYDELTKLLDKYKTAYESIVVKENIDYTTALKLYIAEAKLPGVTIESGLKRNYQFSTSSLPLSLSHIIGYVGKLNETELKNLRPRGYSLTDTIGKTGLEKEYEHLLRGKPGRKRIEVNALGKELSVVAVEPPLPGTNLYLTLDINAQKKLEEIIKKQSQLTGRKKIAAIVMDVHSGEIISLVSWPSFNNNDFVGGITNVLYDNYLADADQPLFNRAIAGAYPSGSTVKLIVAAAALQEKIINPLTAVNSVGGIQVSRWFFRDWRAGGHGITNVTKALAWSVNTFFYYVGGGYQNFTGLGLERLLSYFRLFNLASATGIDLPGENTGFLPSREWKKQTKKENWFIGDTYNLSIGQGDLLVTPLQVALWTATVANGGKIITPHILHHYTNPESSSSSIKTAIIKRENFINPEHFAIIRQGMRECVTSGSCFPINSISVPTAGKTGTAQWSSQKPTHAWFTAFAPYQNPKIVITVLVEEGGEGAAAALPIARDFLNWWGNEQKN